MERLPLVHIDEGLQCFVCGPDNKQRLGAQFYLVGDRVEGEWVASEACEGWSGLVHGGASAALHDEAAAWAMIALGGLTGFTTRMDLRFRRPIPIGARVRIEAAPLRLEERSGTFQSRLVLPDGAEASTAEVEYAFMDEAAIVRMLRGRPLSPILKAWLAAPREQRIEVLRARVREMARPGANHG